MGGRCAAKNIVERGQVVREFAGSAGAYLPAAARAGTGIGDPTDSASRRFTNPAQSPFTEAIHVCGATVSRPFRRPAGCR
jgi:hypothetical protein